MQHFENAVKLLAQSLSVKGGETRLSICCSITSTVTINAAPHSTGRFEETVSELRRALNRKHSLTRGKPESWLKNVSESRHRPHS